MSHLGCRAPPPVTLLAPCPQPQLGQPDSGAVRALRVEHRWKTRVRGKVTVRSGLVPPSAAPALPGPHGPIVWGQWLPEPGPSPAGSHKEPLLCPLKGLGSQCLRPKPGPTPLGPHPLPAWLGPRPPQGPANPARHVGAAQPSCCPHAGMAPHSVPEPDTMPGGPGSGPLPMEANWPLLMRPKGPGCLCGGQALGGSAPGRHGGAGAQDPRPRAWQGAGRGPPRSRVPHPSPAGPGVPLTAQGCGCRNRGQSCRGLGWV